MGGRAGGGARGGGGGVPQSVTGMVNGRAVTYSLKDELAAYKAVEARLTAAQGAKIASQAKDVPTERLVKWANYEKSKMGEGAVRKAWSDGVKNYKSGDYDIGIVSLSKGSGYGRTLLESYAQSKIMSKAAKAELKRRGFKIK